MGSGIPRTPNEPRSFHQERLQDLGNYSYTLAQVVHHRVNSLVSSLLVQTPDLPRQCTCSRQFLEPIIFSMARFICVKSIHLLFHLALQGRQSSLNSRSSSSSLPGSELFLCRTSDHGKGAVDRVAQIICKIRIDPGSKSSSV